MEKKVKSLDDFKNAASDNGFIVDDNTDSYASSNYITDAMMGTLDDINIEMVVYDDIDSCKKAHDSHIDIFSTYKGSGAIIGKDKGKNYYNYNMVSNGYYMVSTRVDNTLIFSLVPVKYKEKIESILNELGY